MNTINLSNKTVMELRRSKFRVQCLHLRWVEADNGNLELLPLFKIEDRSKCLPHGGESYLWVTTPEGVDYVGISQCSIKDSFSYEKGRKIALGRLKLNEKTVVPRPVFKKEKEPVIYES